MFRYLLFALCALLFIGCEQKSEKPVEAAKQPAVQLQPLPEVTSKPVILLKDPIDAVLVETAAEAIPTWRKYAAAKPTLILLSQNPFLIPIPAQVKDDALSLTLNGSLADFKAKATAFVADPTILPDMALSAALDAGFFSKIVWVLPVADSEKILSLEIFRKQLVDSGSATQAEADTFIANGAGFAGTLRQFPINVVPYYALSQVKSPSLLHLDLSFLKALYTNEIKTPIHPLIYQILAKLRTTETSVFAITLSHSHQEEEISLEVRFTGNLIKRLTANPELLDQPLAKSDAQHQQALYLANFFQKEKVLELTLAMEESAPQDAAAKYQLYRIARQFTQGDKALEYLAQATRIDPIYALEYLELAQVAIEKNKPRAALQMLDLAATAYPHNISIRHQQVKVNLIDKNKENALTIIESLKKEVWSPVYYKHIPDLLQQESEAANSLPATDNSAAAQGKD